MIINPYRYAGGPTLLFADTFTDADSTPLTSHTPDTDTAGGGWQGSTTPFISGNEAQSAGFGNLYAGFAVASEPADIRCNARWLAARYWEIHFRADANDSLPTNAFRAEFLPGTPGSVRLLERTAGSSTERASASMTIGTGTDYSLKVTDDGATIAVLVDDTEVISYESSAKHGALNLAFRWHGNEVRIDDLEVYG